jgi:hypothetical protein
MTAHQALDINGDQPRLEGLVCEEVQAVQFWHAGQLEEPVNVAHLKFDESWFRLYFDHGIIFWRSGDGPQEDFDAPEIQAVYRLDDIGRRHDLIGLTLSAVDSHPTQRGSQVVLTFQGGRTVTFFDEDDRSDYAC